MKNTIILINIIITIFNIKLVSQEDNLKKDSVQIKDSVEDYLIVEKYDFLTANFNEERTLIKFGVSPFQLSIINEKFLYSELNSTITFEKKIRPSISIITNLNMNYSGDFSNSSMWYFSNDIGFRYYYSMKKRIRNGIGANNFHSNYISITVDKWIDYSVDIFTEETRKAWKYNPNFTLSWGMQRRIGNFGFLDIGPYVAYIKDLAPDTYGGTLGFGINFKLGLAYGWK